MKGKNPEVLTSMLIKPKNETNIRLFREKIKDSVAQREFQRSFLTKMFKEINIRADNTGGIYIPDPKRFKDQWVDKYGWKTIEAALEEKPGTGKGRVLNAVKSLYKESQGIARSIRGATEPPRLGQVAFAGQMAIRSGQIAGRAVWGQLLGMGAAGLATRGMGLGTQAAAMGGTIALPYIVAKAFVGSPGIKWVGRGLLGQGTKIGQEITKRSASVGAQALGTAGYELAKKAEQEKQERLFRKKK
jgi:hypothetical protein